MQAAAVSADLRTAFDKQVNLGREALAAIAFDDPQIVNAARLMSAVRSFARAQQTADLARELCPVSQYPSWNTRQHLAEGYLNAVSRRLAEMVEPAAGHATNVGGQHTLVAPNHPTCAACLG